MDRGIPKRTVFRKLIFRKDGFYEKIVKNLGETYREFVSDIDMFKNADFSDFVLDLENNVFKCNDPEK